MVWATTLGAMIGPEAVPLATGRLFRVARSRGTPHAVSSRTVQNHPGAVVPRLPVIPKLDAFDCMRLAGEAHDAVSSSWPDTVANGQLLRRSISEVDNDTVEENGITTHPQLDSVKDTIATSDLDPVMIPSAVNLRITQEIQPALVQTDKWYWQNLEDKPISTQGFYLASLLQRT